MIEHLILLKDIFIICIGLFLLIERVFIIRYNRRKDRELASKR